MANSKEQLAVIVNDSSEEIESPMMNRVVLSNLFEYCPAKDLVNCRLVCNLWKEVSLPVWRSKMVVWNTRSIKSTRRAPPRLRIQIFKLENIGDAPPITQIFNLLRGREGEEKYKLWSNPFRTFRINLEGAPCHQPVTDVLLKLAFWNTCGGWMHALELTFSNHFHLPSLEKVIFEKTPNLKQLVIKRLGCTHRNPSVPQEGENLPSTTPQRNLNYLKIDVGRRNELGLQLAKFLRKFSSLKTIILRKFPVPKADDQQEMNPTLTELLGGILEVKRRNALDLRITHLDIIKITSEPTQSLSPSIGNLFQGAQLPLKVLKIDLGLDTEEYVANQILQTHSPTLQTLKCCRATSAPAYPDLLGGVAFDHLRELRLCGSLVSNLNFLVWTPNLAILHINHADRDRDDDEEEEEEMRYRFAGRAQVPRVVFNTTDKSMNIRLERMEELEMDVVIEDSELFVKMTEWMPLMARLAMPLTRATFPIVCKAWKQTLREMSLRIGSDFDEEVLTGIPLDAQKEENTIITPRPPNLTDLTGLEDFSYSTFALQGPYITKHSVDHAFLHLTELKSLTIAVNNLENVTAIRDTLQTKNPNVGIYFRTEIKEEPMDGYVRSTISSEFYPPNSIQSGQRSSTNALRMINAVR